MFDNIKCNHAIDDVPCDRTPVSFFKTITLPHKNYQLCDNHAILFVNHCYIFPDNIINELDVNGNIISFCTVKG